MGDGMASVTTQSDQATLRSPQARRFEAAAEQMAEALGELSPEERDEFERRLTEALDAALRQEAERLRTP